MDTPPNRASIAIALEWASRIMTVSLEMVVPGLIGVWLDGRVGTMPLLTVGGFAFGVTMGVWHLIRMTQPRNAGSSSDQASSEEKQAPDRKSES